MSEEEKKEENGGFNDRDGGQEDIQGRPLAPIKKKKLSQAFEKALDAVEKMNKDKLH